jgi:hypothetical protein
MLLLIIILSGCGSRQPSAKVVGEFQIEEGSRSSVVGEIKGKDYLFLSYWSQIVVLDISNPLVPREISRLDPPRQLPDFNSHIIDIELSDTNLYVPLIINMNEGGLWIVDVADPTSPQEIILLPLESIPSVIDVSNNIACILSSEGFLFFDVADPKAPRLLNAVASPFPKQLILSWIQIKLADSKLYVMSANGLIILDITNPASPKEIGFYANPSWDAQLTQGAAVTEYQPEDFIDFALYGQYAFITAAETGLRVIDIADPTAPHEVAHLDITNRVVMTIKVKDDSAFILERNLEIETMENPSPFDIRIMDITEPKNPAAADIIDNFTDYSFNKEFFIEGNYIFLLCIKTLYVIDVYGGK